jgi:two-component system phosphate regulon sensor histidine kinase PhoR
MHPLRLIFLISLAVAVAISAAFGFALSRLGVADNSVLLISICVFAAILVPWGAAFGWAIRRASDLNELTDRTRRVARGDYDAIVADRAFHGEIDDLARLNEELRALLARQRDTSEEYRHTIQEIVDSMGEGLMALSSKGQIVFANLRLAQMFGFSGRLNGRSFLDLVRKQSLIAACDRALAGHESVERTAIGERQFEVRVFPVAASAEIAAVALFIDITDIERLQRIRKDFLDDFSHEVRTPLAGVRSAAESFEKRLTHEQEEQLRAVMLRQVGRMERLVNDLSELNQIESGGITLDRQEIDLLDVVSDVCDEFRERFPARTFSISGDQALASADTARVQQILANLLDNAVKHGGAEGPIAVETASTDDEAIVRVSDDGEGIPATEIDRIFNRFYRVDRSRSQNVPGIGLGLAIAKHLAAAHGGSIRAFNRPTRGATFELRLPRPE